MDHTQKQEREREMRMAEVAATRAMREATVHLSEQALYNIWQDEERRYQDCRKRWEDASCTIESVSR